MSGVLWFQPSFTTQDSPHAIGHSLGILQSMLPDSEYLPPAVAEDSVYLTVSPFFLLDLVLPVVYVRLRHAAVRWASVPVAPVHEYGHTLPLEPEVGASWQELVASPPGDAVCPKDCDQRKFGALVAPGSNGSHHLAAFINR